MRRVTALAAALAILALAPALARADGDPASDVLLLQNSYLPYAPQVSPGVAKALNNLLGETKAKGYHLRVAVIATQQDLGAVPQLFGKPQNYALFLEKEIAFNQKVPLLVVMPAGFGVTEAGAGATAALKTVSNPRSSGSDDLARSAIDATVALAKANGHPVAKPNVPGGGGGGSTSPLIIFGVPVILLVLAGLLMTLKRRSAEREEAELPT